MRNFIVVLALAGLVLPCGAVRAEKLRVLLIDGQNNHKAWPNTSPMITDILEHSGRFEVTVSTTPKDDGRKPNYGAPQPTVADMPEDIQAQWKTWRPDFSKYDVVVSNYNGVLWPAPVREAFERYVREGGGFVSIHAADNAFAQWKEYNRMIGVGGWYGRPEKDGPQIEWKDGKLFLDHSPGKGGHHGGRTEVLVELVNLEDAITKGMPGKWLHPEDEIYCQMRGPAENLTVLGTSFSSKDIGGSGKQQPIQITIRYGEGRVYHEMLGHDERAYYGVGFQTMLQRGTEWAATGAVTLPPVKAGVLLSADVAAKRDPKDIK